jgi:pyrimidine deaminase RibD-like protein
VRNAIKAVYVGIKEPGTFITHSNGQERLEANGVKVVSPVEHWRDRITKVSMNEP